MSEIEGLKTEYVKKGSTLAVLMGEESTERFAQAFPDVSFLAVYGFNWEKYLSPWPAEKVFRRSDDFGGKADELIAWLQEELKHYSYDRLILAGYSLAGLFCAYAAAKMKMDGLVTCSASYWFPGFNDYLREHPLQCEKVYVSLGDRESHSKSPVFSTIEDRTNEAIAIMKETCEVEFRWNEGSHFVDDVPRVMQGIEWMNQ